MLLLGVVLSTLILTYGARRLEFLRDRAQPLDAGSSWKRATEIRSDLATIDYPHHTPPWMRPENGRAKPRGGTK